MFLKSFKKNNKLAIYLLVLAMFSLSYYFYCMVYQPMDDKLEKKKLVITPGTSTYGIALILEHEKLISSPLIFVVYTRVSGARKHLKAGVYELNTRMSMVDIINTIKKGGSNSDIVVTIPEGYTQNQIQALLDDKGVTTNGKFLETLSDSDIRQRYSIPRDNMEGYLFPDTYYFSFNTPSEHVAELLCKRFDDVILPLYAKYSTRTNLSLDQAINLASIIQKEAGNDTEMRTISGVFHNRLRRRMALQSEATVRYAVKNFTGEITKDELQSDSPYNTYNHPGLPAGPICNPGKNAIEAALNPEKNSYLYFMADMNGTHIFSQTYAQHNRAVAQYKIQTTNNFSEETHVAAK
jgi:UPF0755 protein